jgi:hypothetical protein
VQQTLIDSHPDSLAVSWGDLRRSAIESDDEHTHKLVMIAFQAVGHGWLDQRWAKLIALKRLGATSQTFNFHMPE